MHFHVGQKVICINDRLRPGQHWGNGHETSVKAGVIYTVREIVPREPGGYREPGLRLVEIVNSLDEYTAPSGPVWIEAFFRVSRFFPIQTTNIDVFLEMLARARIDWAEDVEYEAFVEALEKAIEAGEIGNGQ